MPLAVTIDRSKGLQLDQTALKSGEVLWFVQLPFEARRGDFEGIFGPWDEVFYVEYGSKVLGELYAILVGYAGEPLCGDSFWQVFCGACFCERGEFCSLKCILFNKNPKRPELDAALKFEVNKLQIV